MCARTPPPGLRLAAGPASQIPPSPQWVLGYSQQFEDLHVAAERAAGLGAQLDAHGPTGWADHQTVNKVGLAVIARAGGQRRLGSAGALHLHVDLAGGHDHRLQPWLRQCGFLRHQVRAGVQQAQR